MNAKVMAIITAIAMVAVTGFVAIGISDGSDADAVTCDGNDAVAEYNFYVYSDNAWVAYSGTGYNAWSALKNATGITVAMGGMLINQYGYDNINPAWGQITAVNDVTGTWNIQYYNVNNSWTNGINALGFYNAYSDYDANFRTANIAIYNDDTAAHLGELPTTGLKSIVTVQQCDCFKINFTVTNGSDSNTYVGYGSNVYLALKSIAGLTVVGNDVVGNQSAGSINNSSYGYITTVGSLSESSIVYETYAKYTYWSLYVGENSSVAYAAFLAGFYTPVHDSNLVDLDQIASCTLMYDSYTWVF
ncbi:MAG: hypothetical protein MJZ68_02775 [archaeon]|nr:hypothetical protein [archaeon]